MGTWSSEMMCRRVLHRQATDYIRGPMPNGEFPRAPSGNDPRALWWDLDDPGGRSNQGPGLDLIEWISDPATMHAVEQLALVHGGVLFRDFGEVTIERLFEFCPSICDGIYHQIFDYPVTQLPNVAQLVALIAESRHPVESVP